MVERKKPAADPRPRASYFPAGKYEFIPSGCAILDAILGGGWPLGRICNVVGDKSTGKTLLAIEAASNFAHTYPKGKIWYREAEAAFDETYAEKLGFPLQRVSFGPEGLGHHWDTIEDIFEDLDKQLKVVEKSKAPGLYIIDSLDALTSRAELARKMDEGSYSLEKQKMLGQLFRRLSRRIKVARVCVIFISQVRDKIGVLYGKKQTRTGGRSLDFYASLIVWLSQISKVTMTLGGVKRTTAIRVRANCEKNKIDSPFRSCDFTIRFGYGIDDLYASLFWLEEVKMLSRLGLKASEVDDYLETADQLDPDAYREQSAEVRKVLLETWREVEARFEPKRRKYA